MPGSFATHSPTIPNVARGVSAVKNFSDGNAPVYQYPYAIAGVTRDASNVALPNCSLVVFRTADNSVAAIGTSDASGNYSLGASGSLSHYVVAYLPGSPDVAGTTVDSLTGA